MLYVLKISQMEGFIDEDIGILYGWYMGDSCSSLFLISPTF